MDILSALLTIGLLSGVFWLLLRNPDRRTMAMGAAKGLDAGAWAFAGIGTKMGALVFDADLGDVSLALYVTTIVIAVVHARFPLAIELGVGLSSLPILIGAAAIAGAGPEYGPALWLWLASMLTVYTVGVILFRVPITALAIVISESGPTLRALVLGFAGIAVFGFDLFDPVWQAGMEQWLETGLSTLGFFVAGLLLVAAMLAAPTLTAPLLGVGLLLSELLVRGIFCASGTGVIPGTDCTSSILVLSVAGLFLLVRGFVASRVG